MNKHAVIHIVDDDPSVRKAVRRLLRACSFEADAFSSAEEFMMSGRVNEADCLILDIRMKNMSGIDLQSFLSYSSTNTPIIFISGCTDPATIQLAMSNGAVALLKKPFTDDELLATIERALSQDRVALSQRSAGL